MDGFAVTNSLNALLIRSTNQVTLNNTPITTSIYSYDAASRLSTVSDGNNSATYGYLANSPLVQTITFKEGATTRMTTTKAYAYINRLTSITSVPSADATVSYSYQYNDANQRTRVTMADGSYWLYQYDKLGQVTSGKKYWSDNTPVAGQQFGYTFDDIGNRTATQAGGDENGTNLRASSYTPNLLNQYTSRTVPNKVDILGSATNTSTVSVNNIRASRKSDYYRAELTLDNSAGPVLLNMTNTAVVNNGPGGLDVVTNSVGTLFVPQATEAFTYDDDGNLLTDGRWTYAWDAENRLSSMTANSNVPSSAKAKLEFGYDYRDRRVNKKVYTWNGVTYVLQTTSKFFYQGWNLVAEVDAANLLKRSCLSGLDISGTGQQAGGIGGLLAVTCPATGTQFILDEGNGNIAAIVSASGGAVSGSYEHGPFGEEIRASGVSAAALGMRFSTKLLDEESRLVYYGWRFYNPSIGRWLSRDPSDNDERGNLYRFVNNNPLMWIDPFGLKRFRVPDALKNCCTDSDVEKGERDLINKFKAAEAELAKRNIPRGQLPPSPFSCIITSDKIISALAPFPKCWNCFLERRERKDSLATTRNHQVVVCESYTKSGQTKEIVFDWWGDNVGTPADDFRRRWNVPQDEFGFPWVTDCEGNRLTAPNGKPIEIPPPRWDYWPKN